MKQRGFTIVELLIVIVVIAVLALVTIVAYAGIQNRAADAAVQADLRNIGTKAALVMATNGEPPAPTQVGLEQIVKVNKSVYLLRSNISFVYCWAADRFAFIAASKSGNFFAYTSQGGGLKTVSSWGGSGAAGSCTNVNTTNDAAFSVGSGGGNYTFLEANTWVSWL